MANDRYKYFRIEARDILEKLTHGVLQLEKGSAKPELVASLLRFAHTLKGAARVVKELRIAELAHTAEGILTSHRESAQPLAAPQGSELLRLIDEISARVRVLELASAERADVAAAGSPATIAAAVVPVTAEEPSQTVRIEIRAMDSLHRGISEAAVQLGVVRKSLASADRLQDLASLLVEQLGKRSEQFSAAGVLPIGARARTRALAEQVHAGLEQLRRALIADIERLQAEFDEVLDSAHRMRLIPAHSMFASLDRAVRDAAQVLGKRVELETSGGEVRLDADVLAQLRDALMHVVRNAVVHGAQSEAERVAAGKPALGRVRLAVERRGSRVLFVCSDDGRGIDVEAVKRVAVARGRLSAAEAASLTADKVIALLCAGGITTSSDVTEWSGRGIGLDVVQTTAARLKGTLSIRSEPGGGTTIQLEVPISIASLHGLIVEADGCIAAIPLDAVRQTLRLPHTDIARSAQRPTILHAGEVIPFVPLHRVLRRPAAPSPARQAVSVVIVQNAARSVAVGVDRLLGTSNIVVRSLPATVQADPVVSGACLDADGNPQLVLDPEGLVGAGEHGVDAIPEPAAQRRAPILIIDDSLTTRMLEQSILESAGYEVELAISAEQALALSRDHHYGLFIVDVEMPGMDGFEFVAQTRADPALRDIPAILVTSRNAPEDRLRGEQVGARAYIVKGEFDQKALLHTIRTLVG